MQISLRVRLDKARDRFVIEFEPTPGGPESVEKLPVEGMPDPVELTLDPEGYVLAISIPGLSLAFAAIAGDKPQKPGKPPRPVGGDSGEH